MFHDGIILTTHNDDVNDDEKVIEENGNDILYCNKKLENIFDIQKQKERRKVSANSSNKGENERGLKELVNEKLIQCM
jgi:hypothetical protein